MLFEHGYDASSTDDSKRRLVCLSCGKPAHGVIACDTAPTWECQDWFWTPEWQYAEREVEADLVAGRFETFDTMEDFIADLR
jgi:hypothetical protein